MGKHDSSAIPGKADKTPTKKLPMAKSTGATSKATMPACTAGVGKTRPYTGKGNRFG